MKKLLKIAAVILLIGACLIGIGLLYLSKKPAVKKKDMDRVLSGGSLEAKYQEMGPYPVSHLETAAMQSFQKYLFYFPAEMASSGGKYPAVIFSNGTGVAGSQYSAVLEHLASWGFIVVATEEAYSWNGFSSEMCLRRLRMLNETKNVEGWDTNPFFQHVDLDRIGAAGHSQGGVGVINAVTDMEHASMYRAAFIASPTNKELAAALEWPYEASKVKIPTFLVSSTGQADENMVVSLDGLQQIYGEIPDSVPKLMARRNDADHGDMLYFADGYMTAWFLWQLCADETAAAVFCGENGEIYWNPYYQDMDSNLS